MRALLIILAFLMVPAPHAAGADGIDYLRDVKPLLKERCYACHGALKQNAGLRLDTAASLRKGGENGPAAAPGLDDQSLIIQRITSTDPAVRMPAEAEALPAEQIEILKAWVRAGLPAPADELPEPDVHQHWAFVPPQRPVVPQAARGEWVKNPIDAFIAAEQEAHGLQPLPPAPPHVLLRRVYLDLVGLPPTREQLNAFLSDSSPDA